MSMLPVGNVDQAKVLQALGLNIADPKAQATLLICDRYNLDPFLGHMQLVQGKPYVTRDGYLHIAHSSGVFDGLEVLEEGETDRAIFCKVAVYRKDMSRPFTAVGRVRKGEKTQVDPWDMALTRAERRALRRAFNVAGVVDELHDDAEPDFVAARSSAEPFDTSDRPALPVATSSKQAEERKTLAQAAQDMKNDDPVSQVEVDELLARIAGLDAEHRALVAGRMNAYGLSLKATPTRLDARSINQILVDVEGAQSAVFEERRKLVAKALGDTFGPNLSDDERHTFIAEATGGETNSMKRLTEDQAAAIVDACETAGAA